MPVIMENMLLWHIKLLRTFFIVCGCLNDCADKPEFIKLVPKSIVGAGNSVDLDDAPEEKLAAIVVRKIMGVKNPRKNSEIFYN
jgi:hypothetical protein